jgi:hypothetical protein
MSDDHQADAFLGFLSDFLSNHQVTLPYYCTLWQESRDPYYVWSAINVCIDQDHEFPKWIRDYLGQCAKRMESSFEQAKDRRKVLPEIFGFYARRRGRSQPLHPFGDVSDLKYLELAAAFAGEIAKATDPLAALDAALSRPEISSDMLDRERKTLLSRITKEFGLQTVPSDADEWRDKIAAWFKANQLLWKIWEIAKQSVPV